MKKLSYKKILTFGVITALFILGNFIPNSVLATSGPDLIVSSIDTTPNIINVGEEVSISATVLNQGDENTGSNFIIRFRVDGTIIKDFDSAALAKNSTRERTATWTPSSEGEHTIRVCADAPVSDGGNITESKENNNCLEKTVNVKPAPIVACADGTTMNIPEFKAAMDRGDISFDLVVNESLQTSTFTIENKTECTAPVSLSAYERFDHIHLSTQKLFDGEGVVNIKPKGTTILKVDLPVCSAQVDAWYGKYPQTLLDSNPYHYPNYPWVLDFDIHKRDDLCGGTTPEKLDISITKSVSPTEGKIGDTFTYTLRYKNNSNIEAKNTTIADVASPVGLLNNYKIIDGAEHGSCTEKSNGITCSLGTLPAGEGGIIKYTAKGVAKGTVDNTVVIKTSTTETDLTNNKDNARVIITDTPVVDIASCDAFSAHPTTILLGGSSTLTWETTNAVSVSINNGIGAVSADGSTNVSPTVNTTYTLTAIGVGGDDTCVTTVAVTSTPNPPQCTLEANPTVIVPGGSSTLTWTTENVVSATIDNGVGSIALPDDSTSVSPSNTTTYTLTGEGSNGDTVTCDATITVSTTPLADVSITKSVTPDKVLKGGLFTYTLNYKNNGNLTAQNVEIDDTPNPTGILTDFAILSGPNHGTCATKLNGIECSLGSLPAGASGTITYKATGSEAGNVLNTAEITTTTTETDLTNNKDDAEVIIYIDSNPPCTVNCGGGLEPPRVVLFKKPGTDVPFASQSFIYLSQIPYTGVSADLKSILVTLIIAMLSVYISYVLIEKNIFGKVLGFAGHSASNDIRSDMDRLAQKMTVVERNAPINLPVGNSYVGEITQDQKTLSENKIQTESSVKDVEPRLKTELITEAKKVDTLVSDDAIDLIVLISSVLDKNPSEILADLIQVAKKIYPREDNYIIIDSERAEKILFSAEMGTVQLFVDWLSEGDNKKAFEFIRLLRNNNVSIEDFVKKVVYYIDNFYRCQIGEVVDDNHKLIGLSEKNYCWNNEDLQKIVSILVNSVDESYEVQDASIKLALIKVVEITQKAKARKGYYSD